MISRQFWEELEDIIKRVSNSKIIFIKWDLHNHVGASRRGFEKVYEDFGYKNKTKSKKNLELHCSLRPHGSEYFF
jgi:hypothetical protein